jgi:hypothetical protein
MLLQHRLLTTALLLLWPLAAIQAQAGGPAPESGWQTLSPCGDTAFTESVTSQTPTGGTEVEARMTHEHTLARTYAPILRFAPSERYFPTIPFWTAFRPHRWTVTPMSVSSKKAEARTRYVQPLDSLIVQTPLTGHWDTLMAPEVLPSISAVRQDYDSVVDLSVRPYQLKLPLPVVFYRVCDFMASDTLTRTARLKLSAGQDSSLLEQRWRSKADQLWKYLRSDEQAWQRFGLGSARTSDTVQFDSVPAFSTAGARREQSRETLLRRIQKFHVIQYFIYYLQDWGLQGHSEDLESVFVFVPVDTTFAKSFRIVVGAGHAPPAPNNVLVLVGRDASRRKHYHPNILVELGGHSSAPDMPPFGQFSAGLDVNWHIGDLWGTRDEQATAGVSFSGRYEGAMTFPRDQEDAVTLFPKGLGSSRPDSTRTMIADLVRVSPDYLAERAHKAGHRPNVPSAEQSALADSILNAYQSIRRHFEVDRLIAIATSTRRDSVLDSVLSSESPDTGRAFQDAYSLATFRDINARAVKLDSLERERLDSTAKVVSYIVDKASLRWRPDSIKSVIRWLDLGTGRLSPDSLRTLLATSVPSAEPGDTALHAITQEIRNIVTERLLPEYSLVPVNYLQGLYHSALQSDTVLVRRHLMLITRLLHPAACDELACGLALLQKQALDSAFSSTVCGRKGIEYSPPNPKLYPWSLSLACRFTSLNDSVRVAIVDSIKLWDRDVYDTREDNPGQSKQWPASKHKMWEHELYRSPEAIFRTYLFRPTLLQLKSVPDAATLLFAGATFASRSILPYIGFIIPAFRTPTIPFKLPGYMSVHFGPYIGRPYTRQKPMGAVGILYEREFEYFYSFYLKGLWVNHRRNAENRPGASDFTWTTGLSLWCPCFRSLHVRPGIRFETEDLRPRFDSATWELQFEFRQ